MVVRPRLPPMLLTVKQHVVQAPKVKSMHLVYQKQGRGMAGIREFIKKQTPWIRYHNPAVTCSYETPTDQGAKVVIETADGQLVIKAKRKDSDRIFKEFLEQTGSKYTFQDLDDYGIPRDNKASANGNEQRAV